MKLRPFRLAKRHLRNLSPLVHKVSSIVNFPELPEHIPSLEKPLDQKNTIIYNRLSSLLKKNPSYFDDSLLLGCRHLQGSGNEFIEERSVRHIMRLVCSFFFIYKKLAKLLRSFPRERHLLLRCTHESLQFPFGTKNVLGLFVGICPLNEYECFAEKHIVMAVQKFMPSLNPVQGSFYINKNLRDHIHLLYIELEKNDGSRFSLDEVKSLKKFLANTLKGRIEQVFPSLFTTPNDEEVMKTMLILGRELRYRHSLPQVSVFFESQSGSDLFFTVIVVHLVKTAEQSFGKVILGTDECVWTATRIQVIDHLERIPKEVVVFHVKMRRTSNLLRADCSVNFFIARQRLIKELQDVLGQIRDYNGGLISQQNERFVEFKEEFAKAVAYYPDLVENFFYSLMPVEAQLTLSNPCLNKLFTLCLGSTTAPLPKPESYFLKSETEESQTFVVVRMRDSTVRDNFLSALSAAGMERPFAFVEVIFQSSYIIGYIHRSSTDHPKEQFISAIKQAITEGLAKISNFSLLRLAFPNFPVSLDPRIGGDSYSAIILKMLFEGLMKYGNDGELTYGVCESVTISSDAKKYVFQLRKSIWSNGISVTAYDFAYAWQKILSPDFDTPYTYLFYPIKHAKQVKDGKMPLDQLGVEVVDDYTLVVELEHPAPHFLGFTALSLYSPVPHLLDKVHPNWARQIGQGYVCNGPFQLVQRNQTQGTLELVKNSFYWDPQPAQPDQVLIIKSDNNTALQMFEDNEIDWLGSPLQDWNPHLFTDYQDQVESLVSSGIFWTVFNVQRFPFHNVKLRQAFSYALNRKKLVKALAYDGLPAFSPLPVMHSQKTDVMLPDGDEIKALQLFQEALIELGLKKEEFPRISFMHGIQDNFLRNVVQFVIKRWEQLFDIACSVEIYDWGTAFDKMTRGEFQVRFTCWEAWVDDPIYTLNAFKYGNERINSSNWENPLFQRFLDEADQTTDMKKRGDYLAKAESILIQEVPVLPLLYDVQKFVKKRHVQVPSHKNSGQINLRSASTVKNHPVDTLKRDYL